MDGKDLMRMNKWGIAGAEGGDGEIVTYAQTHFVIFEQTLAFVCLCCTAEVLYMRSVCVGICRAFACVAASCACSA